MKTQFPVSPYPEKPTENTVDEPGSWQNFDKLSFMETLYRGSGLNPSSGFNLSQYYSDTGFKYFGSSSENDLYNHAIGSGEGYSTYSGIRFFGSDFSPKNLDPLHVEENYNNNGLGYNAEKGSYNEGPQFENFAMNRPNSEHDLSWSQNRGMNFAESHSPLIQCSDMGINPVYPVFDHKNHSSDLNFGPILCPNIDSSVKNMLCNSMIFPNDRGFDDTRDSEGSIYEDNLILEGKGLKKVVEKEGKGLKTVMEKEGKGLEKVMEKEGKSLEKVMEKEGESLKKVLEKGESRLKGSRGRKEKHYHESTNQNNQSLVSNNNTMISETTSGSLFKFRGDICSIAKVQLGCRFLERIFEEGHIQDIQIIFNEMINDVCELMIHRFANYLIQKVIEVCSDDRLNQIVFMVTVREGELIEISMNTHGSRVVQKLIGRLKTRQQKRLILSALHMSFLDLVRDANGYHVINCCLQSFNKDDIKDMLAAAAKYCYEIATHQHGRCILESCIAQSDGRFREKLATEIASQGFLLAQDAFGNYVVQHVIELKIPSAAAILSSQFRGKYVCLSMQKFSSHVVQTFLKSYKKCHATVIEELISVHHFEQLVQDPFANYVIQTAIDVSKGSDHDLLVKVVKSHSTLRDGPYCKKLFSNLLKKKSYSEHDLTWSQNRGMNFAESHSPLIQCSDMGINPVYPELDHKIHSSDLNFGSMSYPNIDSSVKNMLCNSMIFPNDRGFDDTRDSEGSIYEDDLILEEKGLKTVMEKEGKGLKTVTEKEGKGLKKVMEKEGKSLKKVMEKEGKGLKTVMGKEGKGLKTVMEKEGKGLKKVVEKEGKSLEKGESSSLKGSRGRKKKLYHESTNQNSQSLISNNNPVISETMSGSLFKFRGHICSTAKVQLGCRSLQSTIEKGHIQDIQFIFNEMINDVCELMIHPFAHYLMQKLIEVCSDDQLNQIVFMVTARQGELIEISMNTHGSRVVQKLIGRLKTRQQKRLILSALLMSFLDLVRHAHGYHVIKSCLQSFNKDDTRDMLAAIAKYCYEIATYQHGLCILESCIAQSDGRFREKLATEIASQGFLLAQDAFGNYVVQHVIELKIPSAADILSSQFRGKYVYLSTQKFSSHVVQTFLISYDKCHATVIEELISVHQFEQLFQDPFAKYVIRTAIDVSKGSDHDLLVKVIKSHSTLRKGPYSKKLSQTS